jgi:nitrate reductase / nitrite oxidoreductase, beta subunit
MTTALPPDALRVLSVLMHYPDDDLLNHLDEIAASAEQLPDSDLKTAIADFLTYLANLLTAGDEVPVRLALRRLAAMRHYMRMKRVEQRTDTQVLDAVGLDTATVEKIYRLLALGGLAERFVLPTAPEPDKTIHAQQGGCGFGDAL